MAAELGDTTRRPADLPLAQIVRTAVGGVPGVVGIGPGEASGIDVTPEGPGLHVVVHLVALPVPLLALAAAVRTAVAVALTQAGRHVVAVDVWVDGLADAAPGEEGP